MIIFKTFVRSHRDYGDVLYEQAFNSVFQNKLESIQYNVCLAITDQLGVHRQKKSIKNLVKNPPNLDVGAESFVCFTIY